MVRVTRFFFLAAVIACLAGIALPQTDELRTVTGFPIPIGQPVIFGKVDIKGLAKEAKKPMVFVSLLEGGTQIGRIQTNDLGYYYFLTTLRGSGTLLIEINGGEVGRVVVNSAPGPNRTVRQDVALDWEEFKQRSETGVLNVSYSRDPEQAKLFDAAMQDISEKNYAKAMPLLDSILAKDPKDYVSWTEMGTIFFKTDSLDNAEACYFKAIELKKDYFVALLNLGKLYIARKKADDAILVLSNAVKVRSTSADSYYYLGEAYLMAKKGSMAVPALNEAIRLAPVERADAHLRLASLYDAAGLKTRAAAEYKLFLGKRPDYPEKAQLEKYIQTNPPQ